MITSNNIDCIVLGLIDAALAVFLSLMILSNWLSPVYGYGVPDTGEAGTAVEYEEKLFDTDRPMTVSIVMDTDKWADLLANASEKKWQSCDVVINGTRFHDVGIRAKGDSSLSSIAGDPDRSRYSFKLKFDKYIEGQSCFGLDKLCLNNNYGDATNMKEAFVYDMFRFLGADASLYNYAKIMVNGEYWGVYLALEAVDNAFLRRNYGTADGALYKPGGSAGQEYREGEFLWEAEEMSGEAEIGDEGGADLNYIDDDLASYRAIWSCQVNRTNEHDHRRVVEALKNIGEKKNPGTCMDVDNILRYMAVHNFSVNNDSLSGDGAHNYYLYEENGKLNLIPWDYNLCLGAYEMEWSMEEEKSEGDPGTAETATDMVNHPVDDPWRMTSFFDGILQDEKCLGKYHEYYGKLVDQYILGGGFDVFYYRTRSQIDELVRSDPNALYSYEAYDRAAEMLKQTVNLRGQSIKGQLNGTIPSTKDRQKQNPEKLIDARSVNLEVMGSDSAGPETEGSRIEDGFSTEDWTTFMKEFFEQQRVERQGVIRKNGLLFLWSFMIVIAALLGIRAYHRHRV